MPLKVGDPVELINSSISRAGGTNTQMDHGLTGRICKITEFGFCNVQFEKIGCRRVHKRRLKSTNRSAPACSHDCS
jgi:hypothetical protein